MGKEYEKHSPEGGWGHLVTVGVVIAHLTTVVPLTAFGLVHGAFLASVSNETTGTTSSTTVFLAMMSFTGLLTGYLFGKYSYRTVGTIGAIFHLTGSVSLIFVINLPQFMVSYGVLQGVATGMLIPSAFSSLNDYFHKKLNLMTGIAQIAITVATILYPPAMGICMETIGYKNTKIAMAAISILNFFAVWSFQPVEWHTKHKIDTLMDIPRNTLNTSEKPLLNRTEVLGQINSIEDKQHQENTSTKVFDFSLLKSPRYLNLVLGVVFSFHSDNLFVSMLGAIFHRLEFSTVDIATLTMVHFGTDLVARIIYAVVSAFYPFRNRYLFYVTTGITALFRIVFVFRNDYIWRMAILAILGFLRCFIQTPNTLVIAEEYRDNFSTAFTLSTLIGGIVSLVLGPLMSIVKHYTNNADMVIQVLTGAMLLSVIMWSIEFVYKILRRK